MAFRDLWLPRVRLLFLIALVFLFLLYVWPTFWRYDHHDGHLVRFDRLDGSLVEVLTPRGWVRFDDTRTPNQILKQYGIDTTAAPSRR